MEGHSLRILYVEDNNLVREVTSELLAEDGRKIVALRSAEEALEAFRSDHYDIVITDVSLPVMSGVDLARTLLRDNATLPIIIASGYSLDFGIENWGQNVRTIIKPFESDEINALIAELSNGRSNGS
jgi:two-component system, cell cycle response regulator CpdR